MKVVEIRDEAEWQRLEPHWNQLLESSASATTFLTWEWTAAWWAAYGAAGDLWILAAFDEAGVVRGIAPLRRQTIRAYTQTLPGLVFLADGSNDSDYLDFIIARGYEKAVIEAFSCFWQQELKRGVILRLSEIPASSPNLPILSELTQNDIRTEHANPCTSIRLPTTWDDYVKMLRPRFRTKIRSLLRNLESRADIRFGFCEDDSELQRLLPALFDLHTRRWNQDGQPGVFGWDRKRQFYGDLSRRLLSTGSLRFSWLEWNGRILACQYGFLHAATYLHLQEGYEPVAEHWNIGVGLRAWTIRELMRGGAREYDFLGGIGRHKTDWGAEVKESRQIILARPSYKTLLFCRAPAWEQHAKATVKKMLPATLLEWRQARSKNRGALNALRLSARQYIREAVAQCYFHLGVPAVAQRLRQRYQVSYLRQRTLPRLSWIKRREPAGRIFCYHRVNDDRDPFFPSMPVDVFERQMRFVARHYKVVSLSGLIAHLESGSPQTVLALTFDDGYRDNFENAFPILRRYGLPATIFLSTGSVDTGELLWFERLAAALKTTAREFLDVEFDLPRRFWLRNREERLNANGELFTLLRRMPDDERRTRLEVILKGLTAPGRGQRNDTMLTWEQIRHMKKNHIDFGGHTVTHSFLSRLNRDQVNWELIECKRRIEMEVQAPVEHFAYPSGHEEDFGEWNKDALRAAGYQAAVTTIWGLNYKSTDRFELRRSGPWEEDEALFACKMGWYDLVNG